MQIRRFIAEQPAVAVAAFGTASRLLQDWDLSGVAEILLLGSGSSLNANTVAAPFFASADRPPARVVGPTDFLARAPIRNPKSTLAVILSQTGASTTSIAAARKAAAEGARVIAVTANAEADLAALGYPTIVMPVGAEPIGPKTKGYAASCATLSAIASHLVEQADDLADRQSALDLALQRAGARASRLAAALDEVDYVMIGGDGASYGTAREGSLKIAEIAGLPTAAFTFEEMLHGRLHGLTRNSLCIPIASDQTTRRQGEQIGQVLSSHGIRVEPAEGEPSQQLPEPWNMIASIFFFQHLAVELCIRRGRDPDLMRYPDITQKFDIKTDDQL